MRERMSAFLEKPLQTGRAGFHPIRHSTAKANAHTFGGARRLSETLLRSRNGENWAVRRRVGPPPSPRRPSAKTPSRLTAKSAIASTKALQSLPTTVRAFDTPRAAIPNFPLSSLKVISNLSRFSWPTVAAGNLHLFPCSSSNSWSRYGPSIGSLKC